ncbi:MAG: M43 family zinc metalloprotease [Rubricoccaceae bacterium]|nr:M43 family zinc metalloprotease [Rubricoccaceae bacterium]
MRLDTFLRGALFGVTILALSAPAIGQDYVRCSTRSVDIDEQLATDAFLDQFISQNPSVLERNGYVLIPIAYHVIDNTSGASPVTQQWLDDQTQVLNDSFFDHGIQFEQASVDYTVNNSWYTCTGGTCETAMKTALAIDPATTLNFYINHMGGGLLGWATFPDGCESCSYHGVVVLDESLPGGSAAPYNEGDTGTHEVGHFVGLYHTFQGGCTPPGDSVPDTNYEANPRFGCPIGAVSCGTTDPVENFMDYTDDDCMNHFTPGQADRMAAQMAAFRPTMWDNKVPVELTSFNATVDGSDVTLDWVTASETNNAGFDVQLRPEGEAEYRSVGFVEGHGTTTEAQVYSYTVDGLRAGAYTFRLKQIDFDGAFEYSPEIEAFVSVPGGYVLESAYPNPFNPEATFRFGVRTSQSVTVELVDMLGRSVGQLYSGTPEANVMQTVRIDGSSLTSGVYLIRVVGETFADVQSVTLLK